MSESKLQALRKFFPKAQAFSDGGVVAAYLPGLAVETPSGTVEVDALLYPQAHSSYSTRLFTDREISAPNAKNWKSFTLGGRTWFACSWQGVEESLPWVEMLAAHMRAFR
jgi:hypothetical protein